MKKFDAETLAEVVYCPKTNRIGELWPVTWMGGVIFLYDGSEKGDEPLDLDLTIFDDQKEFNNFKGVCKL